MLALARRVAATAALATVATLAPASPAAASGPGTAFVIGDANFSSWPCPSSCLGNFQVAGVVGADAGGVVADMRATFTYTAACTGSAAATATLSGAMVVYHPGPVGDLPRPFTAQVAGATITFSGQIAGTVLFTPNPLPSCTPSSVTGGVYGPLTLL